MPPKLNCLGEERGFSRGGRRSRRRRRGERKERVFSHVNVSGGRGGGRGGKEGFIRGEAVMSLQGTAAVYDVYRPTAAVSHPFWEIGKFSFFPFPFFIREISLRETLCVG